MHQTARYLCPVCHELLSVPVEACDKTWRCINGHSFDQARQGYLNLLLAQQRNSRAPGDTAEMVQARSDFLNAGYYQPLASTLCDLLQPSAGEQNVLLDLGCGEGYYTRQMHTLGWGAVYGLDISKPAILAAARQNREIHWSVASMRAIPLEDASVDAATCVFAYYQAEELLRVLKPQGRFLLLVAGPDHLLELRQAIYPEVKEHDGDKALNLALEHFTLLSDQKLHHELENLQGDALWQLLQMTPHFWRAPPPVQEQVRNQVFEKMTVDIRLLLLNKPIVESNFPEDRDHHV
ncbi:methyltransferase domain-containing protein [Nitrincola alkalilacustris]|uniref:methyltransferase domain-containing protein n=1 Tax=Nitrincola alkalilacustris TaxID=1571224 RepID=UPI00124DD284|nr:methyltransferase domain-containing protein [Nitrincola alkalilacustris]